MKSALVSRFASQFGTAPEILTRAPGRIEFIGNHTDYNGGTVLGAAIDRAVWVALAPRAGRTRRFASGQKPGVASLDVDDFARRSGDDSWVNYPLGVLQSLRQRGHAIPAGFDYLALSDLPLGAGLSSSAAIEMASALAFTRAAGLDPAREELVRAAKDAENTFVGVPCGILDQGVSGFGRKDHLVFIDCRGPRFSTVPLPAGAHFWIFNTHTKHALVDGLYAARHRECMEAARALGVTLLVEAPRDALSRHADRLSPVAAKRARHIIEEIARVDAAVEALRRGDLAAVGRLLTASHRSSQTLFENSTTELDFLVDRVVGEPGVFGARLTGGGFGGAVMAMTSDQFTPGQAKQVAADYERRFGAAPDILHLLTADGAEILSIS